MRKVLTIALAVLINFVFIFAIVATYTAQAQSMLDIPMNVDCDKIRDNEMVCLACNIYHEARGEGYHGQLAVANVTRNRVDSYRFPDTFCDVVWERHQFSWTNDGRSDKVHEDNAWENSFFIARLIYDDHEIGYRQTDITEGALWYHSSAVKPDWTYGQQPRYIGNHRFYVTVATKDDIAGE